MTRAVNRNVGVKEKPMQVTKESIKLKGMTEWFMPKEIDEMQKRLNKEFLELLKMHD